MSIFTWATISMRLDASEEQVVARLEQWFYEITPDNEAIGDVAMSDFESIYCVCMTTDTTQLYLHKIDPFVYAYFLFYEYNPDNGVLCILGGYTYEQLHACSGHVIREHLKHCRAFQPYGTQEQEDEQQQQEDEQQQTGCLFYLPVLFDQQKQWLQNSVLNWTLLPAKLEWIAQCALARNQQHMWDVWDKTCSNGPMLGDDPVIDYGCFHLVCLVLDYMFLNYESENDDMARADHSRFNKAREFAEKALLYYRMKQWTKTDAQLLELLQFNNMDSTFDSMAMHGRTIDNYFYWQRFPEHRQDGPPSIYYRVPMEEVSPFLLKQLPLYKDGTVLLSRHDVVDWIWTRACKERRNWFTYSYVEYPDYNGRPELLRIAVEMEPVVRRIAASIPEKKKDELGEAVYTPDIEDLIGNMMPLCMRNLVNRTGPDAFPKDQERVALVRVLRRANISEDTTGLLLNHVDKKERGKQITLDDTKKRYDYTHTHRAGYAPVYCSRLVPVAMEHPMHTRIAKCPFYYQKMERARAVFIRQQPSTFSIHKLNHQWMMLSEEEKQHYVVLAGENPSLSKEQRAEATIASCKDVCFKTTIARLGTHRIRPNDREFLSGPVKVLKWALQRK